MDHLLADKSFLEGMVQLCPDGIIGVNREGVIVVFNAAAEKLTGLKMGEILGRAPITKVYQPPELARDIKRKLYSEEWGGYGRLDGLEVTVTGADGRAIPIRLSATLLFKDGQEIGSVGYFHDLSERKQLEEELRRHSITDSLTGLYNRRHFHTVLTEEVARSQRYGRPMSLASIDLDNFKPFNDNFGHSEGDNILRFLARHLRNCLRTNDSPFRVGGDEFALIMPETDLHLAAQAMRRMLDGFKTEWEKRMSYLGAALKPVTISLGISELQKDEKGDNLILRSDLAMYEAKRAGGDKVVKAGSTIGLP